MQIALEQVQIRHPGMSAPLLTVPSTQVASGERILLRGASGAGKTSLLHVLTGLAAPHAGDVQLGTVWLRSLSESGRARLRREDLGFVFQRLNILEHLTAVENVQLGAPGRGLSRADARAALARVDLSRQADQQAWQLSLGEQQRVAVARVLAARPRLVVADEPTSSLDAANAERVASALIEASQGGATLLVATHDPRIVAHFERHWTVADGGLVDTRTETPRSDTHTDTPAREAGR